MKSSRSLQCGAVFSEHDYIKYFRWSILDILSYTKYFCWSILLTLSTTQNILGSILLILSNTQYFRMVHTVTIEQYAEFLRVNTAYTKQ